MNHDLLPCLLNNILLPLFVVALLFAFAGVGAEVVLKGAVDVITAIIGGFFKLIQFAISMIIKRWK